MLNLQKMNCKNQWIKSHWDNKLQGKSFLTSVFCVVRAVLWPGSRICIAAGNRGQSIVILEYIRDKLMPNSPELRAEIKEGPITTASNAYVTFHNGSTIKVVTASDSARSNRATLLVVEEFRLVRADIITTVLRKFLTEIRHPGYLDKPEYQHLAERSREVYLSSAWYKSHWSYQKMLSAFKNMLDDTKRYFLCGLPYQLSIREGLLLREQVEDEMAEDDFNEVAWSMEMSCEWWGAEENSFFDFEAITRDRKIQYPWLSDEVCGRVSDPRVHIPRKQAGEIRILSADLALMASGGKKRRNNDATAIFINQVIRNKDGRSTSNFVFTDVIEGAHTEDQALYIRKLFDVYECDWIAIDARGVGAGIVDALLRDLVDKDGGIVYPAISVYNDQDWAARCTNRNAPKVIWAISASPKFNSDCALGLREGFKSGKVRLLISEFDAEELLSQLKGWNNLNPAERLKIQLPYINTTLAVDEIIKLEHDESSGLVKISERAGNRKDRYSSMSYNYWVACQLDAKNRQRKDVDNPMEYFKIRAPKIR